MFTGYLDKVGQSLDKSVTSYNQAVGSLSGRVLVSARKLAEMKVATGDLNTPRTVEQHTRELPSLTSVA